MVLTKTGFNIHELLSNFISPLDLDNSARICGAWRIALTSSKSKKVQKRLLMQVNTFNFHCFEMRKEEKYLKKT